MTKKEQEPTDRNEDRNQERERHPRDVDYNPNITEEDRKVLNNQSQDERKGDYFKDRKEPIDFEGEELDIPELDDKKFNQSVNKTDDSTKNERPKDSANSNDSIEPNAETIYKNEDAERYQDPSIKENDRRNRPAGPEDDAGAGTDEPELDEDTEVTQIQDNPKDYDNSNKVLDPGSEQLREGEERQTERDPKNWREDKKPGKDGGVL